MNRDQRASSRPGPIRSIGEAYAHCQFRSLVSTIPGTEDELLARIGAAFAALGGDVAPIDPDTLAELVATVRGGRTVIVLGDRRELRDAAKAQLMSAINAAHWGATGSA